MAAVRCLVDSEDMAFNTAGTSIEDKYVHDLFVLPMDRNGVVILHFGVYLLEYII
jgi:hypothetical protein